MSTTSNVTAIGDKKPKMRGNFSTYLAGAGVIVDYSMRRHSGEAPIPALAKAGVSAAFYNVVPWAFGAQLAYAGAKGIASGLPAIGGRLSSVVQSARSNSFGGNYQETQPAVTMRQRGVQSIQKSVMNSRSLLGQEARMMFRG
jgi:hypothetical protein